MDSCLAKDPLIVQEFRWLRVRKETEICLTYHLQSYSSLAETESYKSEPVGRIGAVVCELYVFPVGSASGVTALKGCSPVDDQISFCLRPCSSFHIV